MHPPTGGTFAIGVRPVVAFVLSRMVGSILYGHSVSQLCQLPPPDAKRHPERMRIDGYAPGAREEPGLSS